MTWCDGTLGLRLTEHIDTKLGGVLIPGLLGTGIVHASDGRYWAPVDRRTRLYWSLADGPQGQLGRIESFCWEFFAAVG
jgi:hypothetical protein